MNNFRYQRSFFGWGILLGIYPIGPVATPRILHGTISVEDSQIQRGQDDNHERQGPDGRAGRLTYIPDDESVNPSRPFPPTSHSGEGPIVEAIRIPGGKNRVENLKGTGQGTDPFARKHFLTVVAMRM